MGKIRHLKRSGGNKRTWGKVRGRHLAKTGGGQSNLSMPKRLERDDIKTRQLATQKRGKSLQGKESLKKNLPEEW